MLLIYLLTAILLGAIGCGGDFEPLPGVRTGSGGAGSGGSPDTGSGGDGGFGSGGDGGFGSGGAEVPGPSECGNGIVEFGESCDPPGTCPSACDDGNACTSETLSGSPDTCDVVCQVSAIEICADGDGCCPSSCSSDTDNDCVDSSMCGGAGPATTPLDAEEQAFLVLLNEHRSANGLGPVAACTALSRASQGHSEDMRDQDYFDHSGLNGSSPIERACDACYGSCGVTGWGENIAAGNSGAQGTFNQWVNSPGHNANMLGSNFAVVGIGRATGGGTYGTYWTTVFGGRSDSSCD